MKAAKVAGSVRRKGFEAVHRKHAHVVKAFGVMMLDSSWDVLARNEAQRHEARVIRECQGREARHMVEYLHARHGWLTAGRDVWGKTIAEAWAIIGPNTDRYRVVVETTDGRWVPAPRPRKN